MEKQVMHRGIVLGSIYRHKRQPTIEGYAVSFTYHLTGCDQVCIERLLEGKLEYEWVDITLIEDHVATAQTDPGGPQRRPPSARTPPRGPK